MNDQMTADQIRQQWKDKKWADLTEEQQRQARNAGLGPDDFQGSNS